MNGVLTKAVINALVKQGMSVSNLSDILDIQRKSIYEWLDGNQVPNSDQTHRLALINGLLGKLPDKHLRFYFRFWNRELSGGESLKLSLCSNPLDSAKVLSHLDQLKNSVERAYRDDIRLKANRENMPQSPAGSLTEYLVACAQL